MCDRKEALQYVITNRYGSKEELKSKIHVCYEEFISVGFISEPARIPSWFIVPQSPIKREWVATDLAFRRAKVLGVKPDENRLLDSNRKCRPKRHLRKRIGLKIHSLLGELGIFY